ncbi:MAG: hypothetical protein ACOVMI_03710 [Chitinophagaceae bacterium]
MIQQITNIKQLVQQLVKQQQVLEKENTQLKKELSNQSIVTTEQTKHIEQLKQKIDGLKLKGSNLLPEEKSAMVKRIDGYLKEIDLCLEALNKE